MSRRSAGDRRGVREHAVRLQLPDSHVQCAGGGDGGVGGDRADQKGRRGDGPDVEDRRGAQNAAGADDGDRDGREVDDHHGDAGVTRIAVVTSRKEGDVDDQEHGGGGDQLGRAEVVRTAVSGQHQARRRQGQQQAHDDDVGKLPAQVHPSRPPRRVY